MTTHTDAGQQLGHVEQLGHIEPDDLAEELHQLAAMEAALHAAAVGAAGAAAAGNDIEAAGHPAAAVRGVAVPAAGNDMDARAERAQELAGLLAAPMPALTGYAMLNELRRREALQDELSDIRMNRFTRYGREPLSVPIASPRRSSARHTRHTGYTRR